MGLAKRRAVTAASVPEVLKPKKLSEIKDKEEKRFRVNDAIHTLKRFAEMKREIREIKADPELFDAAKAGLKQEIADTKAAMKS